MTAPIQIAIYFVAGDTVTFDLSYSTYPSTDWDLTWVLGSVAPLSVPATYDASGHHVIILPATSATILPGRYATAFIFTNRSTNERRTVPGSSISVLKNPTSADSPTWATTTLAAVETALTALAGRTNAETTVNGQTYRKEDMKLLSDFRDRLLREVDAENAAAGRPVKGGAKTIHSRFAN